MSNRLNGILKLLSLFCLLFITGAKSIAETFSWEVSQPSAEGMSSEKLEQLCEGLQSHGTQGLLVIRHDKIVCEWYAAGYGPDQRHGTASLAKAMVGGMSLAVAMQDGRLKPDDSASVYVPQWRDDPVKSKITISQLATHCSGLDDAEQEGIAHDKLTGWKGEFWSRAGGAGHDPFSLARDVTPMVLPPGKSVRYSNPGMAMLSYAITTAIQPGNEKDVRTLLNRRVFEPIGIKPGEWSVGYEKTYVVAGLDLVANWGGAAFTTRAAARVGRLMLHEGDWVGHRLLSPAVVHACIEVPSAPADGRWEKESSPRPGFGWWTNRDRAWKSMPRDAYVGAGAGHQLLLVVPSLDMVAVRFGVNLSPKEANWIAVEKYLLAPLAAAVTDMPYPPSDLIRSVKFDPKEAITRKALDSDNWPMTSGDDDRIYTAYGDGRGFEPFIKPKLSLGLAVIEGTPPDFTGINLRSESAERAGGGEKGPKASGMLMVDGLLHMWVRNTGNATLATSSDHGKTWTWGFKFEKSFGCPAFLNFGRNYEGALDAYVYTYSQDGPSAYEPYDGIVMARVPRKRIAERAAYEFYMGQYVDGQPRWTANIDQRQPVFRYPGHCERIDAIYNAGLKRYLLVVSFGHGKGWGIFDAPKPWGPWTTAFSTRDWGLGDTHGYRIPTKWISPDGTNAWLVFSGRKFQEVDYDAFCLRRMTIGRYPD